MKFLVFRDHHDEVVRQLEARVADKQAELERVLVELGGVRRERDQFRSLFVEAMGAHWNEKPIAELPLQTRTLKLTAAEELDQIKARWSPAEQSAFECWMNDIGHEMDEPERYWLETHSGASPLEVLA